MVDGQVYRSAQPSPDDLRKWTGKYGLKTVINLRGAKDRADYQAEVDAAKELGLTLIDLRTSAQRLPSALWVRRLIDAIETSPRPILIHCQAGADRTGLASVIAAMAVGGRDYASSKDQLSIRLGHVDGDQEHIAGMLAQYEEHCRGAGLPTGGWQQFRRWAVQEYHPGYFRVEISAPQELTAAPRQAITLAITIRNTSGEVLPAGAAGKVFNLACFTGTSEDDSPDSDPILGPRLAIPARDLHPGESVQVEYPLSAPATAGVYDIRFDLVEEGRTWFARQGSTAPTCRLVVASEVSDRGPKAFAISRNSYHRSQASSYQTPTRQRYPQTAVMIDSTR